MSIPTFFLISKKFYVLREAAKNVIFFSGRGTYKRGSKGPATKEKSTSLNIYLYFSQKIEEKIFVVLAILRRKTKASKPRGGG